MAALEKAQGTHSPVLGTPNGSACLPALPSHGFSLCPHITSSTGISECPNLAQSCHEPKLYLEETGP